MVADDSAMCFSEGQAGRWNEKGQESDGSLEREKSWALGGKKGRKKKKAEGRSCKNKDSNVKKLFGTSKLSCSMLVNPYVFLWTEEKSLSAVSKIPIHNAGYSLVNFQVTATIIETYYELYINITLSFPFNIFFRSPTWDNRVAQAIQLRLGTKCTDQSCIFWL